MAFAKVHNSQGRHRRKQLRVTPTLSPLEDRRLLSLSSGFDSIDGASAVRSQYGVTGTGAAAAVIDMGVNYQDSALGGGLGAGSKTIAGYDFADNSSNPIATASQHGTAVAGIIASSDPNLPGIAPGANIVPLKVFSNSNQGNFAWVAEALQWVLANHQTYNITVVNISIDDGNNYAGNWFANDGGVGQEITTLIGQLDQANIPVVVAAGNSFSGQQGMGFPAIVSDAISVTALNGADQVASDAQRLGAIPGNASSTTLAAPGVNLTTLSSNNQYATATGTSFAAPQVSGAIILLQQIYESRFGSLPTVAQLKSWLTSGSDPVADPVTGLTLDRLDIPKAAGLIPSAPAPQPAPQPAPTPAPAPAPTPAATTPTPAANSGSVAVYVNGQLQSQAGQAAAAATWAPVLSMFNSLGSFPTVQTWTAAGPATVNSSATWNSIQIWNAQVQGELSQRRHGAAPADRTAPHRVNHASALRFGDSAGALGRSARFKLMDAAGRRK